MLSLPASHRAKHSHLRRFPVYLIVTLTLWTLTGCRREQPARPAPPPAEVEVYVTEELTVPVVSQFVGSTEASQEVDVRARVQGVVWELGFEEGTSVTAGQFLFRIDPRPFEADLQIAQAQTYQAQVAVQSAERDLNRTRSLSATESVAREELDDALSLYETNVAALRLAEAQLVKAQLELSYTTVTAPVRGLVGKAAKKVGDLVDPGANSLLVTITTQDPMFVNFTVAEKDMLEHQNKVHAGAIIEPARGDYEVEIVLLDGTRFPAIGRLNFADVEIDPMTGTGLYRAVFANPKGILKPGMFVEVLLKGAKRTKTIMVPQNAVMQGMQGSYVYVVGEDKKVEMRPVQATDWEGLHWIIEQGLDAGERVIIAGTNKTAPGADVDVTTVTETLDLNTTATTER